MGVNVTVIEGNLGKDPQVKFSADGKAFANFSIAVNEGYGDKKKTSWFDVTAFGKQAESCGQYLKKGAKVVVTGRLQTREWTDKAGQKRVSTEIAASQVNFMDPKSSDAPATTKGSQGTTDYNDEIPF